ncbi:nitrite reductase (NAD(P)H) small subunit [Luteimicrobium subarcticum]|uniref:Nitrite reductase (NADH) small subunit n=1 Tax=Luteimicrobium subarcticum TaxID=620910 RepID=A0A2M8W7A2_9MICO|nr:nitrite reductase (NAD(P)H) small subunit [Luteimicrobium subarcticum]PJI86774.1 nitrite reductase (NADH) small subunit [Luteimicrobium subarcticum]
MTTLPVTEVAAEAPAFSSVVWVSVCRFDDLVPERGAAALLPGPDSPGGHVQVALVRLLDGRVLAVDNHDPFSGANVLSRGIVGWRTVDGRPVPTLSSPLHKQVFSLETGTCLDTAGKAPLGGSGDLRTYPVRVVHDGQDDAGGLVQVGLPGDAR